MAEPTRKICPMTMLPKRPLHFLSGAQLSVAPRTAYDAHAAILLLNWGRGGAQKDEGVAGLRPMTRSRC